MTTLNQAVKSLNQRRATEAALTNEQITRQRVLHLERVLGTHSAAGDTIESAGLVARVESLERHVRAGFRGRLRWLLTGR